MRHMASTTEPARVTRAIDDYSFALGIIFAFSEVVAAGVKQLALSEPASPEHMQALLPEATRIAKRHAVEIYLETDLIQTDLFPADVAAGSHVLLMYRGDVLERYLALKADAQRLAQSGEISGPARRALAVRFGKLLSYTDARIDEMLKRG